MYSLTRRLLIYVSLALAIFFGLTATALDAIFRDLAERSLRQLLDAQIVALISSAETDAEGRVVGASTTAESRLQNPGSGLYAQIGTLGGGVLWRSPSAAGTFINFNNPSAVAVAPFRLAQLPDRTRVAIAGRGISWEYGTQRRVQQLVFAVATDMAPYDEQLRQFRTQLYAGLVVLGLLVVATIGLLLRWVMSPVQRLEREIEAVESGEIGALGGGYPRELTGVTRGLNALLGSERKRIERYRDTLGNLAHSLKTPLAVIRNSLGSDAAAPQIGVEVDRMQGIIEHQMSRAATTGGTVIGQAPVPVLPIVQELRLTLLKVHGRKDLSIEMGVPPELQFLGDRADLTEALGNLIDNACKWCEHRVRIEGELLDGLAGVPAAPSRARIRLRIEDDGSGMPEALRANGPQRGLRADESTPGHGIGLAMVADMAELYGGELQLGSSPLGGARIDLVLPGTIRSRT